MDRTANSFDSGSDTESSESGLWIESRLKKQQNRPGSSLSGFAAPPPHEQDAAQSNSTFNTLRDNLGPRRADSMPLSESQVDGDLQNGKEDEFDTAVYQDALNGRALKDCQSLFSIHRNRPAPGTFPDDDCETPDRSAESHLQPSARRIRGFVSFITEPGRSSRFNHRRWTYRVSRPASIVPCAEGSRVDSLDEPDFGNSSDPADVSQSAAIVIVNRGFQHARTLPFPGGDYQG